jgi:hypothetical protein
MTYITVLLIYLSLLSFFNIFTKRITKLILITSLTLAATLAGTFIFRNQVAIPNYISIFISSFSILLLYAFASVKIINQGQEGIVERLGRYHRKLRPGANFIVPFLDSIVLAESMRERFIEISAPMVFTQDQVVIDIKSNAFFKILDLERSYYSIENLEAAIGEIVKTSLRAKIGKIKFSEINQSRDEISKGLLDAIDEAYESWGARITRVEIQEFGISESFSTKTTLSIPFPDGIDWSAFKYSFVRVIADNDEIELTIQGIERREDGVMIVKVKVPENMDKDKILIDFGRYYGMAERLLEEKFKAELKGKDEQIDIYRRNSASMEKIVESLSSRMLSIPPQTIEIHTSAVAAGEDVNNSNTDNSRNINVGHDLNLTGSTLNLGEINGAVTNSINQLPESDPEHLRLKELLIKIRDTVNSASDSVLPQEDKVDALEQIKVLAEASQQPEEEKNTKGGRAIRFLQRIVNAIPTSLPVATSLVTEMNKLIPQIATLLGIL